ncbi:MAG: fucose isomerase [Bacteroidales bacterium]|nr:fucose isomerase [Bacteroidales bacterium]
MNILILRSSFQTDDFVRTEYAELLGLLKDKCNAEIKIIGDENVETFQETSLQLQSVNFVMIATGGTENLFKKLFAMETFRETSLQKTITLIADGRNNSLAASLEILSYLSENGKEGRILHGTNDEIVNEIVETRYGTSLPTDLFNGTRIGVFGQPSDWLIASGVDYEYIREHYGIETVFIDLQRLVDEIGSSEKTDMLAADKTYTAIKKICQEERLDAMTIRCFDIVKACNTTSCLALAKLNDEGIVAGCEGDMQTLMTMLLAKKLLNEPAFMANPSILTDTTSMFAHCTVPLSMCYKTSMRTHFESGIGVAVQGDMPLGDYTIMKWGGRKLDKYFVTEAKAIKNEYSNHFCRTQITFDINLKPYLLNHPIGNHHVIIKGRHAEEIKRFLTSCLASRRP